MNEIREVAKAYYDGAPTAEKVVALNFFEYLDGNRDRKVSLADFKKKVDPSFSDEDLFKQLDQNGDGTLDFKETLALYYMSRVSIPRCSTCRHVLLTSYFSCLPCLAGTAYSLCCDCYGRRNFHHHHSSQEFADNRTLLMLLQQLLSHAGVAPTRRDILDLGSAAKKSEDTKTSVATRDILDPVSVAKKLETVGKAGVEIVQTVTDRMEPNVEVMMNGMEIASGGGRDILEAVLEIGNAAASAGCSIM